MRIAIASDEGTTVAAHTGRCGGFVIFDVQGVTAVRVEFRSNSFTAHARGECAGGHEHAHGTAGQDAHEHAAHSHAPLLDALQDCAALVTGGLGQRLLVDLASRGIQVYASDVAEVDEAARRFAGGLLPRVGRGCCGAHGGGGACT